LNELDGLEKKAALVNVDLQKIFRKMGFDK
jgi:hypothetical protein